MFMVMFAPGGIASLLLLNLRVARHGKLRRLVPSYLALAATAALMFAGAAAAIEMIYHLQLNMALGPELHFLGVLLNVHSIASWLAAAAALAAGTVLFAQARRRFAGQWNQVQGEIAHEAGQRATP
jgi:branched-chain amino acid transport system permease protein